MGGACSTYGERAEVYTGIWWRIVKKRQFGRPTRRCEDNINMGLQEVGCGGVDWIELSQDREGWWEIVNVVMNLRVP
jgi:hypothetical protein